MKKPAKGMVTTVDDYKEAMLSRQVGGDIMTLTLTIRLITNTYFGKSASKFHDSMNGPFKFGSRTLIH